MVLWSNEASLVKGSLGGALPRIPSGLSMSFAPPAWMDQNQCDATSFESISFHMSTNKWWTQRLMSFLQGNFAEVRWHMIWFHFFQLAGFCFVTRHMLHGGP